MVPRQTLRVSAGCRVFVWLLSLCIRQGFSKSDSTSIIFSHDAEVLACRELEDQII